VLPSGQDRVLDSRNLITPILQTMNPDLNFAATIGLDWADQKHDLGLRPTDGAQPDPLQLEQTPEALHAGVAKRGERFGHRPIAIAVETSRGPVISALMAYDLIVLFPVNPKSLKSYRDAFAVSGAKDDRTDAQWREELVRLHRDKLRALAPDTELTRKLGGLVENRRPLVDERTRLVNQIHATLTTCDPLAETLLEGRMNTPMAVDFLVRWPELAALQKAKPEQSRSFFYQHNSRSAPKTEERLVAISNAQALTTDPALIVPARHRILALAGMLRPLHQGVARLEAALQQARDNIRTPPFFGASPARGRRWRPESWWRWAPTVSASITPPTWPNSTAWPPWWCKAGTPKRCISATAAPSSDGRPSTKMPAVRSRRNPGPSATTSSKKRATKTSITRPAARWRTNGCASISLASHSRQNPTVIRRFPEGEF
jgi:hypothetical protein